MILVVIGADQLTSNRGAPFVEQLTRILRYLSPECGRDEIENVILPVVVKYTALVPKKISS